MSGEKVGFPFWVLWDQSFIHSAGARNGAQNLVQCYPNAPPPSCFPSSGYSV